MARPLIATETKFLTYERDNFISFIKHFTNISLINVFGEPLRYYILSFNLDGYTPTENGIVTGKPHTIQMYLPPEYPETPPQITALTPLYHPEVNPTNGRIDVSARWAASSQPTLAKLVNLVAHMIIGDIYKTSTPANPEALAWYEEHASALPLDKPARMALSTPTEEELEQEPYAAQLMLIQDMLKRNQLFVAAKELESLPPDLQFPERDEVENRVRAAMKDTQLLSSWIKSLAEIRELITTNQIYALAGRMAHLPPLWFPERDDILAGIAHAKDICQRFFTLAQDYEKQKAYGKALSCGLAILQHIPDHPDAQALVNRMQQFTTVPESLAGEVDDEGNPLASHVKQKRERFHSSIESNTPWKRIIVIGAAVLAAILIIGGGSVFIKERGALSAAEKGIASAKSMTTGLQYSAAKETLERARESVSSLNLLASSGAALIIEIEGILNSDEFKEGLVREKLSAELMKMGPKHIAEWYPGNSASSLSALNASFLRRDGSKRVFELGCVGRNAAGKSARLSLVLAHDELTGRWDVLDE